MTYSNDSLEQILITQIYSSTELIFDDFDEGATISEKNFYKLELADRLLHEIQQEISKQLEPTNISHPQNKSNIVPMSDRIYSDDEHGNSL